MSLLCAPFVVVNLGCEMLYILEQRLKAQAVAPEKQFRVLADVARALFAAAPPCTSGAASDALLAPAELISADTARGIFCRAAHTSIMRLSDSRCAWCVCVSCVSCVCA